MYKLYLKRYVGCRRCLPFQYIINTKLYIFTHLSCFKELQVLGPLLFLIYMNDITESLRRNLFVVQITSSNWKKFAKVELITKSVKTRLNDNLLFSNLSKTKFVCLLLCKSRLPVVNIFKIHDVFYIKELCNFRFKSNVVKYLGTYLDEYLNWRIIKTISGKLKTTLTIRNFLRTNWPSKNSYI